MRKKRPHELIAGAFLAIGALLAYYAFDNGGWFLLLLWPAGNCLWVGAAYFGLAGRAFGKGPDGKQKPWVVLWMLPFLAVNWATWHAQVFFSSEAPFHEVASGFFLGRRAFERELPGSVKLIVDMTSEFPKPPYGAGRQYRCLPTLDAFVPEEQAFMRMAREAAGRAGGVYVHCANGHGRSAAMMAAILIERGQASGVAEAEAMIVKARPGCAWHPAQRRLLEKIYSKGGAG